MKNNLNIKIVNRYMVVGLLIGAMEAEAGARPVGTTVSGVDAAIHREALPQPPADKKVSWLVHRGGWGDSPAYGSRIDSFHKDELRQDYSAGLNAEYSALKELHNAVFYQDFGNAEALASAAAENGMDYALMSVFSSLAMSKAGIKTLDDCVRQLVNQLSIRETFPGYFSIDGKSPVFIFNTTQFTLVEWKTILQKTRDAYPGENLLFIGHRAVTQVLEMSDPQAYMTQMLDTFDGIMFWSALTDKKLENLELARQSMKTLGKKKRVFWVASNGYWRSEKGVFVDPRGTEVWRDQLKLCFQNDFDGVMIESWNDLEEYTQVAPSRDAGGIIFELLKYYSTISNQREYIAKDPGLLLTHPREVLLGETLDIEVISLPVETQRRTFRLELADERGEIVYRSPDQSVPPDSSEVFSFSLPTRGLDNTSRLVYRVFADDRMVQPGTWTRVRKSKLENPWVRGVVLSDVIPSDHISFSMDSTMPDGRMTLDIKHDASLSRVDIYCRGHAVWSLDAERLNRQREWTHRPVAIELDFRVPRVNGDVQNRCGNLSVSGGALVRGFDKVGRSLVVAPDRAEWDSPASLGRQNSMKLLVDADENARFTLELPKRNQTFSFTLRELREQQRLEYKTSAHGRVWVREINHPVLWQVEPGALGTDIHEKLFLPSVGESFENEYSLWVMDEKGNTFRSQPVTVFSKVRKNETAQWFWNEASGTRFSAPVSGNEQMELVWSFDGSPSRVYDDEQGFGVLARLGGGMFRAGHFEPDAVPAVIDSNEGRALSFDGNDYVQLDAGAFPQGAFELALDVCPEKKGTERQTLYSCRSNLTLFLTPEGLIGVQFKGLADMPKPIELLSTEKLSPGEWSHVSVRYDYHALTLRVKGVETFVSLAKGPDRNVSAESYLGAQVSGSQVTRTNRFFIGKLDNLDIRCGALVDGE